MASQVQDAEAADRTNRWQQLGIVAPDLKEGATLAFPRVRSAFPPIGDYGFLSDCQVSALVAPSGNVEWLCIPEPDAPSVFGAILDRDGGRFHLGPADATVPAARRYLPGTMILETSWGGPTGWAVVRDVLLMGPWDEKRRPEVQRRPPTDYDADHILLRTIECVIGEVQVTLDCDPRFDYAQSPASWTSEDNGYHELFASAAGVPTNVRLITDMRLGVEGSKATARTLLKEGDVRFCALGWGEHELPRTYEEAHRRLVWTAHHWQHWLTRGRFPDHRWRPQLERSALVLKGLTYAPTGALIAAPTTSLPEAFGGERNWDYRYTWIRDSTFTLWALYTLGFDSEANDFFWFVTDLAERDERLQVVYRVNGDRDLPERTLDHLHGYMGVRPVRIGNAAYTQQQNDVWGSVLDSFYLHMKSRDRLDARLWPIVKRLVEQALTQWRNPDYGIWEVRTEPRHYTFSKVMCWVAADRGARLAEIREDWECATRWQTAADEIHADVCKHGLSERGVFTQHYDTDELDASLVLLPLFRFLPPSDPRIRDTVLAVAEELSVGGLIMRYRVEETPDGLQGREGTFTSCSYWLVSALVEIGEHARARQLCERLLCYASPLGLYSEEIDPDSGRHLGNFPQALTHLALINALLHLIESERAEAHYRPGIAGPPPQ